MLAIVFGLATKTEADAILAYAKTHAWNGKTLETNVPTYPWWRIPLLNYLTGTADYHNHGCLWLQPGVLYVWALVVSGQKREAKRVFACMSAWIETYDTVYEVYERDGTPVRRTFYRSEGPFAWSAGLLVYVSAMMRRI